MGYKEIKRLSLIFCILLCLFSNKVNAQDGTCIFNNENENQNAFENNEIIPPSGHTLKLIKYMSLMFVGTFGVLLALPEDFTNWSETCHSLSERHKLIKFSNFKRAFSKPPVNDQDSWAINYIAHPLAGMHFFLSERNYGEGFLRSFLFSTASSITWEYFIESWVEQPSIQDLLATSTVGSLLGEGNYRLTMKMKKNGFNLFEKIAVVILNPVYVIQHGY